MRYKNSLIIATISFCISVIWLFAQNKLTLYIHPRYELFTMAFVSIALITLIISYLQNSEHQHMNRTDSFVLLIALLCLLMPAKTLTVRTAENRSQSSQVSNKVSGLSSYDSFNQDFSYFDVADLSAFLSNNPTKEQIIDKQVELEGFIFEDSDGQKFIARFKLSCCAVDARPLTIPLLKNDVVSSVIIGSWYRISGKFVLNEGNQSQYPYAVETTTVEGIVEPLEPYVY